VSGWFSMPAEKAIFTFSMYLNQVLDALTEAAVIINRYL
jgi:hypothetical protein